MPRVYAHAERHQPAVHVHGAVGGDPQPSQAGRFGPGACRDDEPGRSRQGPEVIHRSVRHGRFARHLRDRGQRGEPRSAPRRGQGQPE